MGFGIGGDAPDVWIMSMAGEGQRESLEVLTRHSLPDPGDVPRLPAAVYTKLDGSRMLWIVEVVRFLDG